VLTDADIQMIKETRAHITQNRTESVAIRRQTVTGTDPFTGDPTYGEGEEIVEGTWKTLISQSGGEGEIEYVNGVKVETDDVIVNFDISVDMTDVSSIRRVRDDSEYTIKAKDVIGLGEPNRHFILLELIK
jgi:hypothetical protein